MQGDWGSASFQNHSGDTGHIGDAGAGPPPARTFCATAVEVPLSASDAAPIASTRLMSHENRRLAVGRHSATLAQARTLPLGP